LKFLAGFWITELGKDNSRKDAKDAKGNALSAWR